MKKYLFIVFVLSLSFSAFSQEVCLTSLEKEVMDLLNRKRAENGLPKVEISKVLMLTANKNVEEVVTQNYLNFKPDKFGDYAYRSEQIRYSSSASTAQAIVRSLTTPDTYTKYHSIILNSDEYSSAKWLSAGICIRKNNIIIIFGEKPEEATDYDICDNEVFFDSVEVPQFPAFYAYVPEDAIVKIKALTYQGETLDYDINTLSSFVNKGTYLNIPLDEASVATFTICIRPQSESIVPTEPLCFTIGSGERGIVEKTISFKGNSVAEIEAFIRSGHDVNFVADDDPNSYSMLERAVARNNFEAVEYLLKNGADINYVSPDCETAVWFCRSSEMFDFLKKYKPDYSITSADKTTLLHAYSQAGLLEPVKYCLEVAGLDVNGKDRNGGTPLLWAVQSDKYDVAEYLLGKGAGQEMGWLVYPIHDAVDYCDLKMVKLLVKYGADVNAKDGNGNTPLYHAKVQADRNEEIINYLIEQGGK